MGVSFVGFASEQKLDATPYCLCDCGKLTSLGLDLLSYNMRIIMPTS